MRTPVLISAVLLCATLSVACIPRSGFVSLQFCDSHESHYSCIFPLLESYGFKGTFACITEISDLGIEHEAYKMQEIHEAGHEIMDHTTRHDYLWATHVDTLDDGLEDFIPYTFAGVATWDSLCERSLFILDSLGIAASGWSQPGGCVCPGAVPGRPDWVWRGACNESLYSVIGSKYTYATGSGVLVNTAHLNLRGHNCPERYPFFNLPHVTIDNMDDGEIRTEIANAVASGIWFNAVSHGNSTEQLARVQNLVPWLYEQGIEVLRCEDGVQRVLNGEPDPYSNQIPQARMLHDRDANGKPDGFCGACLWKTTEVPPVDSCHCMRVYGETHFSCYGPEVGRNAFSVWLKTVGGTSGTVRIIYMKFDFDWVVLGECYNNIEPGDEWALIDSTVCSTLAFDVEDEVDGIKFIIRPAGYVRLRVAYPSLLLVADAGVSERDMRPAGNRALRVAPNPVQPGEPVRVMGSCWATLYDVNGRSVITARSPAGTPELTLSTTDVAPGVYLVVDRRGGCAPAKVVINH